MIPLFLTVMYLHSAEAVVWVLSLLVSPKEATGDSPVLSSKSFSLSTQHLLTPESKLTLKNEISPAILQLLLASILALFQKIVTILVPIYAKLIILA